MQLILFIINKNNKIFKIALDSEYLCEYIMFYIKNVTYSEDFLNERKGK